MSSPVQQNNQSGRDAGRQRIFFNYLGWDSALEIFAEKFKMK